MVCEYDECSIWQDETRRCGVVLHEVFAWLRGAELARCGAACRAWRRAAAAPALWRRLLLQHAPHAVVEAKSWRQEYVTARAGWSLEARHAAAAGGGTLLHAALAPAHDALALAADDAALAVWRCERGAWRPAWRTALRERGWAGAARVHWARAAPRLLLAGPLALVDDWELMVFRLDDDLGGGSVTSRVRCSAGAAGCWVDAGDAFLSLELRLLAPGLACTTVWLNAATQETQSEYAGVTAPLLRIFNEGGAHITHALVTETEPDAGRTLVTGSARGLSSWPVARPRPPPLLAGAPGELAERVRRHRARRAWPEEPAPEPDEASVRGACAAPDRECALDAPLVGLVLDDSGRWLWALCSDGSATRVCARSLTLMCVWRAPGRGPHSAPTHYVQPAVSELYMASPEGACSPRVWTWALRSGARAACGAGEGAAEGEGGARHRGAAVCALLPRAPAPRRAVLLTLAADTLYVQHALRALRASARAFRTGARALGAGGPGESRGGRGGPSGSCGGPGAPAPCSPCGSRPPPPCRAPHPGAPEGVRVVCCPQRPKKPPPCPPASCTLTCSDVTRRVPDVSRSEESPRAAGGQDCVAWRLQRAERSRRLQYEDEVAARAAEPPPPGAAPPAPYALGADRELARATDGRLYAISRPSEPHPHCSPTGEPPPPRLVTLEKSNPTCHVGDDYVDPCAHRPRVFLKIDRSATETPRTVAPPSSTRRCAGKCPRNDGGTRRAGDLEWCKNPPSFPGAPQRCRPLTIVERLRARPSRLAPRTPGAGNSRRLHTSAVDAAACGPVDGLQDLLRARDQLKEAGRGRVVLGKCMARPSRPNRPGAELNMHVPPGATGVCVRVYLDGTDCGHGDDTSRATGGASLCRASTQTAPRDCRIRNPNSNLTKNGSWLSIKSIQKKLTSCSDSKVLSAAKAGEQSVNCRRPPSPRPAARHMDCPRPHCPPRDPAPADPVTQPAANRSLRANRHLFCQRIP